MNILKHMNRLKYGILLLGTCFALNAHTVSVQATQLPSPDVALATTTATDVTTPTQNTTTDASDPTQNTDSPSDPTVSTDAATDSSDTTNITNPSDNSSAPTESTSAPFSIPSRLKVPLGSKATIEVTYPEEEEEVITEDETDVDNTDNENNKKIKIKWKSNNRRIATVSTKGVVTANKPGRCRITATYGNTKLVCRITVPKVRLSMKKKIKIPFGVTMSMPLIAKPEGSRITGVKWSSSNSKIVKINKSGKATAQKPGKCTIYARSKYSKKKLRCTVTVPKVTIRGVKSKVRVPYSSGTYFIQPKFKPEGSVLTIKSVRSTKKSVATAHYVNGIDGYCLITITPKKSGNTTLYVKFSNGVEKKISVRVPALSLNDRLNQLNYQITSSDIQYTDGISNVDVTISNLTSRKLAKVDYTLIEYNINGKAIKTTTHSLTEKIPASDSHTENVIVDEKTYYTKCCISKIHFASGQKKRNPLYKKWLRKYKRKYS